MREGRTICGQLLGVAYNPILSSVRKLANKTIAYNPRLLNPQYLLINQIPRYSSLQSFSAVLSTSSPPELCRDEPPLKSRINNPGLEWFHNSIGKRLRNGK